METIGDLDLDQISPRFNVQLKHNTMAKQEFTLDLVSPPVFAMGKNPCGAFVLCIELGKIRVVVKSLLQDIVGQKPRIKD